MNVVVCGIPEHGLIIENVQVDTAAAYSVFFADLSHPFLAAFRCRTHAWPPRVVWMDSCNIGPTAVSGVRYGRVGFLLFAKDGHGKRVRARILRDPAKHRDCRSGLHTIPTVPLKTRVICRI